MADDPWIVQARTSRTCTTCSSEFSAEQVADARAVGWTPLRRGWRCPTCTRAYESRVDRLARKLIADYEWHRWLRADEHQPFDACVFCDVIRRATELLLTDARRLRQYGRSSR
jgi:hypothetical protein